MRQLSRISEKAVKCKAMVKNLILILGDVLAFR